MQYRSLRKLISHLLFVILAAFGSAAPTPDPDAVPFTAQELAQGFRERVILARPHPSRRATADREEAREGIRVREKFRRLRDLRVIDLDSTDNAARAIARLRASGRYEFVEPDYLRHLTVEPNDPRFTDNSLWALKNNGANNGIPGADIKAPAAWDIIREAPNVIVAVVDSGVNLTHQDLVGNLWTNPSPTFGDVHGARFINGVQSGNPADDNGHGTHVAGTIGAIGDNSLGVTGVAWRVQIMAVKVFPASGRGSVSDIARGIDYAVAHGAHIINASYGESGSTGFSQAEFAAISAARDAGVIFVAAAGNAAANMDVSRFYPASHALDNIVTVGASGRRDEVALFSNYGSAVDLFAPGSEILSLASTSDTSTATHSGTSMAAPHVSGALALLKARFPSDNYRQLINRILRSAEVRGGLAGKSQTSARLNILNALQTASDPDGHRPFNDSFARRPHLSGNNLALRASNAGATADPGEPALAGTSPTATLWWEWTAPTGGNVSVSTSGSTYDTVLAVYSSAGSSRPLSPNELSLVAANDDSTGSNTSRVTFTAQAGVTYQFAVDGKFGQSGLTLLNLGTTPANDMFASPVMLSGQSVRLTSTNANASRELNEPRIVGFPGSASLWYRWTAPRPGRFQVAAFSNDFDPLLAVFAGPATTTPTPDFSGGLIKVAENDNGGAGTASLCTFDAVAGTTYSIVVDTKFTGAVGQFTLSLTDSRWQATTGSNVTGAPAVGRDGTLYVGSTDYSLYAYAPDGSQKWRYTTGGLIDTCSPAIADDGTVYIGSNDGRFAALNPATGAVKWVRNFGLAAPVSNSPALAVDGTIYVKPGDGFLYALNPVSGAINWRFNVQAPTTYASPSVAPDGTIYQGSDDKKLYAINPNGTIKWIFAGADEIYSVPAIDAAGNIYFTVLNSGKLYCVTPAGTLRWVYAGASLGSSSSPALSADGGTAYYAGYDAKLHAVNTATGAARWVFPLGDEVRASSPAVDANGVIYIGCYDFKLYAINPDGTLKRTWDTGDWIRSSPAIAGTTLYVGSNDHKLYAFDIGVGSAGGPWPQYRQNVRRLGRAIAEPLAIATAPQARVAVTGERVELKVVPTGTGPFTYQWFHDGRLVAGATSAALVLPAASSADTGNYSVTIADPQGALASPLAPIVVLARGETATPARLANFSVRMPAGTGAQTFILGFYLAGSPAKPVLIRAIGPTLDQFGVADVLANPQLQVFSGSTVLATNDDWASPAGGDGRATASAFTLTGAFPLDPTAKDAALVRALDNGSYTVQITPSTGTGQAPAPGASGTASPGPGLATTGGPGVALAELYDTAPLTGARLANFSARGEVGTGGNLLIGGFTIVGNTPKTVVIRGVGPTLAALGVTGVLADPKLTLYRGTAPLAENDNWGGTSELVAAFSRAGAFGLGNGTSRDAALLVTLAPGNYTAQVSGVNRTTGVGLIEVFEVP